MSTVCENCGVQSSSALCWACDDDEFTQVANEAHEIRVSKRNEDIALLRSILNDDECVDKLLSNPNHITDKLLDVDEELISRITGKALCPKKKIDVLKKKLIKYMNDPKQGNANTLVIECIGRGHIKNHKRTYQELIHYIHDNFNINDLPALMTSEILKPIYDKAHAKAKTAIVSCARDICTIMKEPKYGKYITSGRVDATGVKRTKEEVEINERSLRAGLTLKLLINCKDINLKQGAQKRNQSDDTRRQGREYMVACMLVDIYKCMYNKYAIPAPLFGILFKTVMTNCNIELFIKENEYKEYIERCETQANTFRYAQHQKVKKYIEHMEEQIKRLNGNKNEAYFRKLR